MKMIKKLGFMMLLLATSIIVHAQQRGPAMESAEMAEQQTSEMVKALDLNIEQEEQVKVLNIKYAEKMATARKAAGGDREKMRAFRQEMKKEKDADFKAVLTEEQFVKYAEMSDKPRKRGGKRGGRADLK